MPSPNPVDRRRFIRATAAAAAVTLPANSYAAVAGAGDRVRVAFVGCGARAQAHVHLARQLPGVAAAGVCDVWDGLDEEYEHTFGGTTTRRRYAQGLYPSAVKCGLDPNDRGRVTKDYRRLLDRADVDAVVIAAPDHWHARMALDAAAAGKHALVETPLCRTPAEAVALTDAARSAKTVLAVAAQGLADPGWRVANDLVRGGALGHVGQLQGGAFRNDARGQWRFYRVVPQMTPKTIDWSLFLGHRFEVSGVRLGPTPEQLPFAAERFAHWRCHAALSAGPFADLLFHPAVKLLAAGGLRLPARVSAGGGLFHEHDGRDVPDVATLTADFAAGCQLLLTATTLSGFPLDDVVRGRLGSLVLAPGEVRRFADDPARGGRPVSAETTRTDPPRNETQAVWDDFLACVRDPARGPLCPVDLGAAASVVLAMGWDACRLGFALAWDADTRAARPAVGGMPRFGGERPA